MIEIVINITQLGYNLNNISQLGYNLNNISQLGYNLTHNPKLLKERRYISVCSPLKPTAAL